MDSISLVTSEQVERSKWEVLAGRKNVWMVVVVIVLVYVAEGWTKLLAEDSASCLIIQQSLPLYSEIDRIGSSLTSRLAPNSFYKN